MNDYRAQLSDQHARYREALREVKKKHKMDISRLSECASNALTSIVERSDEYDIKGHVPRYLRHLLHESSEMVFYAFRGQLAWQTGLNIAHRIYQTVHIEDNLDPSRNNFGKGDFRRTFKRKYFKDPNFYLESDLVTDRYFCSLVLELKSRIEPSRSASLLVGMQDDLIPFRSEQEKMLSSVRESVEYLDELMEEGSTELFPLQESPGLYSAIRRQKVILDTLSHLRIPVIEKTTADRYYNYVSLSIHACAVLHAIQDIHSWGWHRD